MKKIFVALSMVAFLVGCDDSSSASAENNEPTTLSSAEKQGSLSSGSVSSAGSETLSSSSRCAGASEECDEAISSDSNAESNGSSSSKQNVKSSSSFAGKDVFSSSSVTLAIPCKTETEDKCEYGTLLDDRDGQTYKTVKIGSQWWMAENLNYYDSSDLSVNGKSWCYNDSAFYCERYGRLYTWAAAIDSMRWTTEGEKPLHCGYGSKSCGLYFMESVHGICPSGWHMPKQIEWGTLYDAVGGRNIACKMLKSQNGWYKNGNGTDAYGFNARPVGARDGYGNFENDDGESAVFWSSDDYEADYAFYVGLSYENDYMLSFYSKMNDAISIRCIKD